MNSATEYLAMALLLALRAATGSRGLPRNREGVAKEFSDRYGLNVDQSMILKMLLTLEKAEFLTITDDRYAGESLRFFNISTDDALRRNLPEHWKELFSKGRTGGVPWFDDVLKNDGFWDDLARDPLPEIISIEEEIDSSDIDIVYDIPASDRIVRIGDNQSTIDLLSADLRAISEEIRESNEASVELGEEKEIISSEIIAAETLISQPSFRVSRLYGLILPALRFLADKFASGAIGEMAKRIILLLLGMA
jgi:hypothetical protein